MWRRRVIARAKGDGELDSTEPLVITRSALRGKPSTFLYADGWCARPPTETVVPDAVLADARSLTARSEATMHAGKLATGTNDPPLAVENGDPGHSGPLRQVASPVFTRQNPP